MSKKTILVTGASGFLGRPLVGQLLSAGHAVRAATRGASFPISVDVIIIPDLANMIDWKPILSGVDIVIHLAGLAHADVSYNLKDFNSINLRATQRLARAAKEANIKRFVFISSVRAQSGASSEKVINEEDEPYPTDNYGLTKIAAEAAVRATGVPFTILRPVVVYGSHPKGNIKNLVRIASNSLPLPFSGLNQRRSMLGIDNFVSAVLFVIDNPAAVNETYLVADPNAYSVSEIVAMVRKAQGRGIRLFKIPPALFRFALSLLNRRELWTRLGEGLIVDSSKLRALGYQPPVSTYEGIVAMVRADGDKKS